MVPSIGDTVTASIAWVTVISALPDAVPALAVIVATPLAAAVTRPDPSTVATAGLLLTHATVPPATTSAFWSRTSAANCTVAPNAVSSAVVGLTASVVGRGTSGIAVGLSPSPHPLAEARAARMAQNRTAVR